MSSAAYDCSCYLVASVLRGADPNAHREVVRGRWLRCVQACLPPIPHPIANPDSTKLTRTAKQVCSTFCDTFLRRFGLPPLWLTALLLLVGSTHAAFLAVAWKLGGLLQLHDVDRMEVLLYLLRRRLIWAFPCSTSSSLAVPTSDCLAHRCCCNSRCNTSSVW